MSDRPEISIRRLEESSAGEIPRLYRAIYGDDFPAPVVYDSEAILKADRDGDQVTLLAFSGDRVIGQAVASRSAWNPGLYELMGLMVLPEFRSSPAASILAKAITDEVLPSLGWEARYTESTTAHDRSQRIDLRMGHRHCALALNLLPGRAYGHDELFSVSGRVSCVMSFMERPGLSPLDTWLPSRYESALLALSEGFPREFRRGEVPPGKEASLKLTVFPVAGVAYVTVTDLGENLADTMEESLAKLGNLDTIMLQMPLLPGIDRSVEVVREMGFRLGGYLPRWFQGADGLLLQRTGEPLWEEIKLLPPRGTMLMDLVRSDREGSL